MAGAPGAAPQASNTPADKRRVRGSSLISSYWRAFIVFMEGFLRPTLTLAASQQLETVGSPDARGAVSLRIPAPNILTSGGGIDAVGTTQRAG